MEKYRNTYAQWKRLTLPLWILLTVIPMVSAFFFSAQDAAHSGSLSLQVLLWLQRRFPFLLSLCSVDRLHTLIRKLAHFSLYFILGCGLRGLCAYQRRFRAVPCAIALGGLYAAFDEFHQHFSAGRAPSLFDVGIDTGGVIAGCTLLSLFLLLFRRNVFRAA